LSLSIPRNHTITRKKRKFEKMSFADFRRFSSRRCWPPSWRPTAWRSSSPATTTRPRRTRTTTTSTDGPTGVTTTERWSRPTPGRRRHRPLPPEQGDHIVFFIKSPKILPNLPFVQINTCFFP
jgi:hypothetical protein